MIKILNANKIKQIIAYLQSNEDIYFPEKIKNIMNEELLMVRNLVFNQYVLPVAEIINNEIVKLVLFDMRYISDKSRNIAIMSGNIDKEFLTKATQRIKLLDEKRIIKKATIKGDVKDIKAEVDVMKKEGFEVELEIPIGNSGFMQLSVILN